MSVPDPSLWTCPQCGHQFVSRNLWHSCGIYELEDHFKGKDPILREIFDRLVELTNQHGPVTVYAQKSRIVFMVQVRFANLVVRKRWLDFGLWLTRRVEHPLLRKTAVFGPNSFGLGFRLSRPEDIDPALEALIVEAYKTGRREHLKTREAVYRKRQ
jgi:hypothetical protein